MAIGIHYHNMANNKVFPSTSKCTYAIFNFGLYSPGNVRHLYMISMVKGVDWALGALTQKQKKKKLMQF